MRALARPVHSLGAAGLILGAGLLHASYLAPERYAFLAWSGSVWWGVFALAQLTIAYALGLPDLAESRAGAALRGFGATVAAFLVISAFQAVLATPLLPRSSSMILGLVLPLWSVLAWNLSVDADARAVIRDRVYLVVDRFEDARSVELDVADHPEAPAAVVGTMTLDQLRTAGTGPHLVDAVAEAGATILVLDTAAQAAPVIVEQAAELHRRGVRIRTLSLFYEEWIGKLPHPELARVSLLFDIGEIHRVRYVRVKRAVDLTFATVGLVALVPVLLIVSVLNPVFNPGPLFYHQPRVGRDGRVFEIYKLRTMRPDDDAPVGRTTWTGTDDPRITPLGGLLRRSHLDELPQVLNIARGDLSLIGPRPEQPGYVSELAEKIAFYDVRHIVRPGLTGWAQVKQGYAADHADAFEKLQYDFYYLRRQGFGLDAKILRRTVRRVIGGGGR
ncbi:MAG: sugar transferase [Actinomycetota bacterium]